MPELPEVETVVRALREPLIGRKIEAMWYDWPRTIYSPGADEFVARVRGQTFQAINRRAKYILCRLDYDVLIVHLKMTGRLYVVPDESEQDADRWVHARFQLDNGCQLRFSDARKFGKIYLTDDPNTITGRLGPEPLSDDFTVDSFTERISGRKRAIKALLLDQEFLAGIGNIYADESLFRAGIHPERLSHTLTDDGITRLHSAIRETLREGIQHEGASINWYRKPDGSRGKSQDYFFVYGRDNAPCLKCGHLIEKIRVAQRGTHFCPVCQPGE